MLVFLCVENSMVNTLCLRKNIELKCFGGFEPAAVSVQKSICEFCYVYCNMAVNNLIHIFHIKCLHIV